jgi:putative membrane protein
VFREFVLASVHYLTIFALVAILAIELALVRPGIDAATVRRLARIDLGFGLAAVAVILAGLARVFFGLKGPAYYLGNWIFWTKMGVFALIGLLSIQPTLRFLAWRRLIDVDPNAIPAASDIARVKRVIHLEAGLILLLPILAAAMARGYGLP